MNKSKMDARAQNAKCTIRYAGYPIPSILEAIHADGFGQHTPFSCRGTIHVGGSSALVLRREAVGRQTCVAVSKFNI
jgi:hypothetical protein